MPNTDTTVYTIFAGYVPTLGFKQDDFSMGSKHGTSYDTINGTRYGGSLLNYGMGLAKDGSVRMLSSRIPGSIAWFEFSTSIRDVNALIEGEDALGEMTKDQAAEWYGGRSQFASGFNKEQESDALLQDVSRNLGFQPSSISEEIEGSGGHSGGLSKADRPEERDPGAMQGRTSDRWDEGGRLSDEGAGAARGLDLYLRDIRGNILRLDVTEKSLFASEPHHGINWAESSETAESLLAMTTAQQESHLLGFFQQQQTTHWNPKIANLVTAVERSGSQAAQNAIRELQSGRTDLHNMTAGIQTALREMRGGGEGQGSNVQAQQMLRSRASGLAARNLEFPSRNMTNYKHMQEVMAFALHHLGNVVRNFSDRPGVQTPGMTSYPLTPEGSYGATAVAGVYHRVHESGASVFQFRDLVKGDVIVVDEAHMSQHFIRQNWLIGVQNQDAILREGARNQSLLDAAAWVSDSADPIYVGEMYSLAQQDSNNSVKTRHSASMLITPETMNSDINNFINNLVADPRAQQNMHAFLKNKIRNVSDLTTYRRGGGKRGQIRSNFNPRGGPMLTAELNNSMAEFQTSGVESGAYADWLAETGAMALTPAMAGFSGTTSSGGITRNESEAMFNYDMGGYRGKTGSSGMQQFGGRANLNNYGGTRLGDIGRTRATGYGIEQGGSVSQDFIPLQNQAWQDSNLGGHGSGRTNRAMLASTFRRAVGGSSNLKKFLTSDDAGLRMMGVSMGQGSSNWQEMAQSMGPDGNSKYYREGEYTEKSRKAGWGTPNQPQLWAAPYVSIYYPAKQPTVVDRTP